MLNLTSEDRTFRGFQSLIHRIPSLRSKLLELESGELHICFRNVSSRAIQCYNKIDNMVTNVFYSCKRGPMQLVETMLLI